MIAAPAGERGGNLPELKENVVLRNWYVSIP
jgi:hypothetical protein